MTAAKGAKKAAAEVCRFVWNKNSTARYTVISQTVQSAQARFTRYCIFLLHLPSVCRFEAFTCTEVVEVVVSSIRQVPGEGAGVNFRWGDSIRAQRKPPMEQILLLHSDNLLALCRNRSTGGTMLRHDKERPRTGTASEFSKCLAKAVKLQTHFSPCLSIGFSGPPPFISSGYANKELLYGDMSACPHNGTEHGRDTPFTLHIVSVHDK